MNQQYLLSDVDLGEEEAQAVAEVVRSKWLSVGPRTAEFESAFAEIMGVRHAVAVSSCTAALHLALNALDLGPGDEVLVPSYTFVASANSILYQHAKPVFVDINGPDDLNLCVADLAAKITPRTKAIVGVHLAGFPADMDALHALAQEHDLVVIEDACHAIGTTIQTGQFAGRKAGTIGQAGCFSFFANKNLVTGEGGMLVTDDEQLAKRVRLTRSHGMTKTSWDKATGRAFGYDVAELGYNYRCTELTAAIGLIQLRKLQANNERRKHMVQYYREQLVDVPGITIPFADRLDDSAHHIFPIVLNAGIDREQFRQDLNDRGIQTSVHYPPVHLFSHYQQNYPQDSGLERTNDVAAREVTLPLHPLMSKADVKYISHQVAQCVAATNCVS